MLRDFLVTSLKWRLKQWGTRIFPMPNRCVFILNIWIRLVDQTTCSLSISRGMGTGQSWMLYVRSCMLSFRKRNSLIHRRHCNSRRIWPCGKPRDKDRCFRNWIDSLIDPIRFNLKCIIIYKRKHHSVTSTMAHKPLKGSNCCPWRNVTTATTNASAIWIWSTLRCPNEHEKLETMIYLYDNIRRSIKSTHRRRRQPHRIESASVLESIEPHCMAKRRWISVIERYYCYGENKRSASLESTTEFQQNLNDSAPLMGSKTHRSCGKTGPPFSVCFCMNVGASHVKMGTSKNALASWVLLRQKNHSM